MAHNCPNSSSRAADTFGFYWYAHSCAQTYNLKIKFTFKKNCKGKIWSLRPQLLTQHRTQSENVRQLNLPPTHLFLKKQLYSDVLCINELHKKRAHDLQQTESYKI